MQFDIHLHIHIHNEDDALLSKIKDLEAQVKDEATQMQDAVNDKKGDK